MASVINQIKLGNVEYAIAASAYAECSTAEATAAKVATICTDSDTANAAFTLVKGVSVQVKFTMCNSAPNPTLNINSTGAKAIYYNGAAITATDYYIKANGIYTFVYESDRWNLVGDHSTSDINNLTTEKALISGTNGGITTSSVTSTELSYLSGAASNIQAQLNGKAASSHGTHVSFTTTTPKANGTAAVGTATTVSRSDHVHPTDTTRAPTSHASSATTYGVGTTTNYGHVKTQTGDMNGTSSTSGVAAGLGHTHSNYPQKADFEYNQTTGVLKIKFI